MIKDLDIKNIFKIVFENVKFVIKYDLGYDVSYMDMKFSDRPYHPNGEEFNDKEYQDLKYDWGEYGGSRTDKDFIVINPNVERVMKYYKKYGYEYNSNELLDIIRYCSTIVLHEMSHEVDYTYFDAETRKYFYDRSLTDAKFKSDYIDYLDKNDNKNKDMKHYTNERIVEYITWKLLDKVCKRSYRQYLNTID